MPVYDDSGRPVGTIKHLLGRPRTHSTGPINPSSSRAPTTSSSSSTGKRPAERSDRGAIEEEADRPLHAVMAGSRGRWNARQLAIACRYGGEEVTGFVCTIQEQVIPLRHHHRTSWVMHLYVCYLHWVMHTYHSFSDLHLVASQSTLPG